MTTTVGATLASAVERLRRAGSDTPRLDADILLAHLLGRDRSWLLAHPEAPVPDSDAYEALIERRAGGEPVAYLRGFKEWHSLRIRTDRRALIPRPETELLADAASTEIGERLRAGRVVAWEVATGSGAVAMVLALAHAEALADGRLTLIASDISPDALALAAENLSEHGVEGVDLLEADLLAPAGAARPRPDVVVANLPYVSSGEVDARGGSLAFEPRIATDGGGDGLVVLRRFMDQLPAAVGDGASVFLEIGVGQADVIRSIAPASASVTVVPDLAGLDRVVRLDMPRLGG